MTYQFSEHDLEHIARVLRGSVVTEQNGWSIEQRSERGTLEQLVTIHPTVEIGETMLSVITVQSRQGYHQLFGCDGYLILEPDEVLFVARGEGRASCLLVGASRTCTTFVDVPTSLLQQRLEELDPAVLVAAMQLSLAEHLLTCDADGSQQ